MYRRRSLTYNTDLRPPARPMPDSTQLVVDLDALQHNLAVVRSLCPESRIMAMVKADGYGHGLTAVAQALHQADGLAVARLGEARRLREAGVKQRLLLLATWLDAADVAYCAREAIDLVVHDEASAQMVLGQDWPAPLTVWLKLDSGMHRLGLAPAAFAAVHARLCRHSSVREIIHMTHLSSADDPGSAATEAQLNCFRTARGDATAPSSIANSAALISRRDCRTEWVRPGIMLYGDNPLAVSHPLALRPVMSLRARVIAIRELPPGEAVGYSRLWCSTTQCRIATVGIGYGDGYPRHAPNGTPVWINGRLAPLVGRVSMDSLTVDVSENPRARVGDEVELWGTHVSAAAVARRAGTISYELFTGVAARVPRRWLGGRQSTGDWASCAGCDADLPRGTQDSKGA